MYFSQQILRGFPIFLRDFNLAEMTLTFLLLLSVHFVSVSCDYCTEGCHIAIPGFSLCECISPFTSCDITAGTCAQVLGTTLCDGACKVQTWVPVTAGIIGLLMMVCSLGCVYKCCIQKKDVPIIQYVVPGQPNNFATQAQVASYSPSAHVQQQHPSGKKNLRRHRQHAFLPQTPLTRI